MTRSIWSSSSRFTLAAVEYRSVHRADHEEVMSEPALTPLRLPPLSSGCCLFATFRRAFSYERARNNDSGRRLLPIKAISATGALPPRGRTTFLRNKVVKSCTAAQTVSGLPADIILYFFFFLGYNEGQIYHWRVLNHLSENVLEVSLGRRARRTPSEDKMHGRCGAYGCVG